MIDGYKFSGLLAVAILLIGLSYIVLRWPKGRHTTFSQHVAGRKQSIWYYAGLFAVTLPILNLFFLVWFIPTFEISSWFGVLFAIASLAQIMCTLIPETGGRHSEYHRLLAGISAILLIPVLSLAMFSPLVSDIYKLLSGAMLVIMLAIVILVAIQKGEPRNFLILQILYFSSFFVPILCITYL